MTPLLRTSSRSLGLLVIVLLTLAGCADSGNGSYNVAGNSSGSARLLRVGITTNAPPIAYQTSGQVTGLEAEFARGLAAHTGRKVKFVEISWEAQIPALLSGKTDIIMSGMTITDARQYQIAFSNPYMISGQVSLVRLREKGKYLNGFSDLLSPSVKIGTIKGTTGHFLIDKKIANPKKKFSFTTPANAVKGVIDGTIDAFVYDLPMNFYFGAQNEINGLSPVTIPLSREEIAWGIRQDDTQLIKAANEYLAGIKANGTLKAMLIRWIPYFKNVFNQ